jgi:hypothetical protein
LREQIRDHACLVVELPGKDTLWLAPQHGMALVRREMTDMTGQIQVVYENGDFRELEKDLWLPGNVSRVVWRRSGDQRAVGEPRIWSQTSRTLVQLRVNDLAPALFQCKLPPGTIVVDKDSKKWHQLPGGLEMLDGVVRAAMSLSISAGRRLPASRYTFAPVGVLMALGAAPWVAIAIGRARKRHQMRRQEQQ